MNHDKLAYLRVEIDNHDSTQLKTHSSSLKIEEDEWLTTKEAARYLGLSEAVLRNMTSNGSVPYYKLGRSNRYNRNELKQLLFSNKKGAIYGN